MTYTTQGNHSVSAGSLSAGDAAAAEFEDEEDELEAESTSSGMSLSSRLWLGKQLRQRCVNSCCSGALCPKSSKIL